MKKLVMRAVKGVVGLLPKPVKLALKKNTALTELYSSGIRKSGLFYGIPSKKKQTAMYQRHLKWQRQQLATLHPHSERSFSCNVVVIGEKGAERSLESLREAGVELIAAVVVCKRNLQSNAYTSAITLPAALEIINLQYDTLFIYAGDTVDAAFGAVFAREHNADIIYCDTDTIEGDQTFCEPRFLPDWNPDLLLSTAYLCSGVVVSANCATTLRKSASATIAGTLTSIWLLNREVQVAHVPYTLVHSTLTEANRLEAVDDVCAVLNASERCIANVDKLTGINTIQWPVGKAPLVSLIIPTKDCRELVKACIESILNKTLYTNFEILLIDNGSTDPESLAYFETLQQHPQVAVHKYPGVFNYSAINNFGVQHANGDIIGLINNDIEVISSQWLGLMVGHALRDDVGCVGAKLLYSDQRIQHAGVVLGYGGGAGHAHKYFPRAHPGYLKRLSATQNYSAVTAACLVIKKSLFEKVGGLNEDDLAVAFNDVDFCLRVGKQGVRNVYCAEAELFHHESVSRGTDISPEKAARFNRELAYLRSTWQDIIRHDPAYSPNLTLKRENFSIKLDEERV